MTEIRTKSIRQLQTLLNDGQISSVEIVDEFLDAVHTTDKDIHSFISLDTQLVRERAQKADQKRSTSSELPLLGIPVGIKDLILSEGEPGRAASKILDSFVSPYSATCVTRLKNAGAIPFGRLNMDEFAMGSSTENSAYGVTRNPWNLNCVPGGSSGGSASAVAARQVPATLGTDTGGSIRQPAAFCGVTGLKPTYGRISRYGVIAFASSLDQVGPLATTAEDCALLLEAMCGHDPHDATTSKEKVPAFCHDTTTDQQKYRIGLPKEFMNQGLASTIGDKIKEVANELQRQGHTIKEISLPASQYAVGVYYIIATAEASSNLSRYDGVKFGLRANNESLQKMYEETRGQGFGPEVKRRIMLGTYALSSGYYDAYYGQAQKVRTLISNDFEQAFNDVDLILSPTTPSTAFELGSKLDDPLQMYLADIFTISTNLAGLPGLSMPCGFDNGMPVGAQLIGPAFQESRILSVAHRYQQATNFHRALPTSISKQQEAQS